MGRIYATFSVDTIIFKDLWIDLRGRARGEVGKIVADEIEKAGFKGEILQIPEPEEAIRKGIELLPENGLFFICAEKYNIIMKLIKES